MKYKFVLLDGANILPPKARRFLVYPSLSFPLSNSFAYLTPKVGLHYTHYDLNSDTTSLPNSTRTLPIVSLDSGNVLVNDLVLIPLVKRALARFKRVTKIFVLPPLPAQLGQQPGEFAAGAPQHPA